MKSLLISYSTCTIALISLLSLVFDIPVSTIPRTVLYISFPILIVLETLTIVIEHYIGKRRQQSIHNMIKMPIKEEPPMAKSA